MEILTVREWIDVPPAAAWAVLTDFARPQRLAPTITRCDVAGEGIGAVRTVHSSRGLRIEEQLTECDEAQYRFGYAALETGDMPFEGIEQYRASVRLLPENSGTTVIWRASGRVTGPVAAIATFLDRLYRVAIANLAAEADRAA